MLISCYYLESKTQSLIRVLFVDAIPPKVEEAFGHFAGIFNEQGFFDFGDEESEGERRNAMDRADARREVLRALQIGERAIEVQIGMDGVAAGLAEENVIGFMFA